MLNKIERDLSTKQLKKKEKMTIKMNLAMFATQKERDRRWNKIK